MPRTGARGIENELARRQAADSGETSAPLRTEAEIEEIKKKCQIVSWIVTGGKEIPIYWVPGQGFFWTFPKPGEKGNGTITGDSNDLERKKSPNYVPGVIFHESRHAAVSHPWLIPPEIWNDLGGAIGVNWFEDNRIEYKAGSHVADGDTLVGDHLAEDTEPFGGLDYRRDSDQGVTGAVRQKIGYIPKHMVLGAAARQYFYLKEYAHKIRTPADERAFIGDLKKFNQEVGNAFEEMLPDIEAYYQTSPRHGANQAEIDELGELAKLIYVDRLWPKYKKLVEKSRNDQALKDFIDKLIDGQDPQGGGVVVIDFDSLPPDIQKEIKKKMQGGTGGQGGQPQGPGQPGGEGQPGGAGGDSEPSSSPESGAGGQGAGKGSAKPGAQPGEGQPTAGQGSGKSSVPWDKLSPEAQKAAKEAFDKLKPGDQAKIKEEADGNLGDAEDAANEELGGHSNTDSSRKTKLGKGKPGSGSGQGGEEGKTDDNESDGQTNPSANQAPNTSPPQRPPATPLTPDQREAIAKDAEARINQTIDKLDRRKKEKGPYHDALRDRTVVKAIDYLVDKFSPLFKPVAKRRIRYDEMGDVFDADKELQDELDNRTPAAYEVEGKPTRPNYRFTFVVDLSESMADKIGEVFKMIVILNEVMTRLGIDCAIIGYPIYYQDKGIIKVYRPYNDDNVEDTGEVSPEIQTAIGGMLKNVGGGTPTSKAMTEVVSYVAQRELTAGTRKAKYHFVVLWTDGQPDGGPEAAKQHISVLEEWARNNNLNTMFTGLGVGQGTEFINEMFDKFPAGLRREMAKKLNGRNFISKIMGSSGAVKHYDADSVDKSFTDINDLIEVLPDIIEWMLENPEEFVTQNTTAGR
jgi:hypothetical protein